MSARILAPLLVLGSSAFLLTNCSSSDGASGTPTAGSPAVAGANQSAGGPATAGAPAGGGGSSSLGGSGSAGLSTGGTPGTAGSGGAGAGASQGGSAGASGGPTGGAAGAAGQATAGGSSAGSGGQGGGVSSGFALTSSKLMAGMKFPTEFTCGGDDHSPPLAWTPGPSATLSYALVLLDTNNSFNHWVVWDLPPSTAALPESLPTTAMLSMPAGAKQASGQGMGYLGPCPGGTSHTYKFTLYALDVATLPGVTTSTTTANLAAAIEMHDIASASLSATSDAKKP